jgi:sulfate permease, SulP family
MEFAGFLGDLGTLIPLSVALITINGLGFTPIFLMVGLFYLVTGYYYRLPIPVQPLKVVAAIAIAFPDKITLPVMSATGILFGIILTLLAITGLIDKISGFFTRPIVRGIQLGLGFILMIKGIALISDPSIFVSGTGSIFSQSAIPFNLIIGIIGFLIGIFFISSRRYPAALILFGMFAGMELALIVRDLDDKKDFFIAFLIAGIAVATKNMGIAFGLGIIVPYILKSEKIKL